MKFSAQSLSAQSIYEWYRATIRNPKYRWWIILGTLAYVVSPFDIAPDFLPIIGQIDDVVILTLLVSEVSQLLIDRVKTRKGDASVSEQVASESSASADNASVDVDAVPIK